MAERAERIYLWTGALQGLAFGGWGLAGVTWWVVDLDLSPLQLVLLGTFLEGTVLLGEVPTGIVADVYSRKMSIVIAWLLMGVAQVGGALSPIFGVLLIWQVLFGLGWTFQSGADTAWVTDEIGREDDSLIMRHAIWRSVALIIGILVAAAISQWSLRVAMVVMGLISLIAALVLWRVMPETGFTPADNSEPRRRQMVSIWSNGWRVVRSSAALVAVIVSALLMSMADEAIDRLDVRRLVDFGLREFEGREAVVWFAGVWILMTLLNIPPMLWLSRRLDDIPRGRAAGGMVVLLLVAAAGTFFLAVGPLFWLAVVGWIVRDVAREVLWPLATAWTNRQAESSVRATVISFHGQAAALGQVAGGLALGVVAEVISVSFALLVASVLMVVATLPFVVWRPRPAANDQAYIQR